MSWKPLLLTALLLLAPGLSRADPAGAYDVKGVNADDGSTYTGEVNVTRTGETYKVVWTIGDKPLSGIGVGMSNLYPDVQNTAFICGIVLLIWGVVYAIIRLQRLRRLIQFDEHHHSYH